MTTSTDLTAIRLDEFLPHPPEKVWRALVDDAAPRGQVYPAGGCSSVQPLLTMRS